MRYAILRGRDLLRYELDDKGQLEFGAKRYPVETPPKPDHDPATEYLESAAVFDQPNGVVRIVYSVGLRPPQPVIPEGATVIIQQMPAPPVDTSATDAQVAALQDALAQMQAARHIGELIIMIQHGDDQAAAEAVGKLEPLARAKGMSVERYVEEFLAARERAQSEALQALKGAA